MSASEPGDQNQQRIAEIERRLRAQLNPSHLEIIDDSHLHAGHAGAKSGKGHFRVLIASPKFKNLKPLERHRMVYEALGEMMQTDIHALSISATSKSPQ